MKKIPLSQLVLIIHLVLLASFVFLPQIRYAFSDTNYPPLSSAARLIYLILFTASFITFALLLYLEGRDQKPLMSFQKKVLLSIALCLIFMFVAPVFSIDFHCYIMQGRVWSQYHQSPYYVPPGQFAGDPFLKGIFWIHDTVYYGPLWVALSGAATFLAGSSKLLNLLYMKLIIMLGYIGLMWQAWRIASDYLPEKKNVLASFIVLNPYIIVQFLIDAHHDSLMVFLLLWSLHALVQKKYLLSGVLFTFSVMVKFISLMFLPFILAVILCDATSWPLRFKRMVSYSAVIIILSIVLFLPFWRGHELFRHLQGNKLAFGAGGADSNTFPYLWMLLLRALPAFKDINPFYPPPIVKYTLHFIFAAILSALVVYLYRFKRSWTDLCSACAMLLCAYFLLEAFQFGSWYILWILPFLLFSRFRAALGLSTGISFLALISFWKRLSFLMALAITVYLLFLIVKGKNARTNKHCYSHT